MFNLSEKMRIRARSLWLLCTLLRPTFWLYVLIVIRFMKFSEYGLAMYVGHAFPKAMTIPQAVTAFIDLSVIPLLLWVPLSLIVEELVLMPLFAKYVVNRR